MTEFLRKHDLGDLALDPHLLQVDADLVWTAS